MVWNMSFKQGRPICLLWVVRVDKFVYLSQAVSYLEFTPCLELSGLQSLKRLQFQALTLSKR
ncbi:hypothetical protein BFW38_12865 [Terasakiispira papahanaumokuakeensis]|uniref:Uncharacterized protein n=1 Tax=Terasakiispira papahanaumokuakeensis TaxID=197479 RepID=A0A1E2VBD6_9GAMM|nr:hypothetical protein BFW38_12865 [Terasakiispira papahanaumokuakeensis]